MKCGDFFIVKIRCYGDTKELNKWDFSGEKPLSQWNRLIVFNDISWNLFEYITKIDKKVFCSKILSGEIDIFGIDLLAQRMNYLAVVHDILTIDAESNYKIFIPKEKKDIYEYLIQELNKVDLPYKILKKTYIRHLDYSISWKKQEYYKNK